MKDLVRYWASRAVDLTTGSWRHASCGAHLGNRRALVLTTYFTTRKDPQRAEFQEPNSYEYMAPWYESLTAKGLYGVVFHDGLSTGFVESYSNGFVHFQRVRLRHSLSTNDYRYFVYRDFIRSWPGTWAFMTDISDVKIARDPFEGISEHELHVGDDGDECVTRSWLRDMAANVGLQKYSDFLSGDEESPLFNAGILGGHRRMLLPFLEKMCRELRNAQRYWINKNMLVFNYLINRDYCGYATKRLCSKFKNYESDRTDVPFIHK